MPSLNQQHHPLPALTRSATIRLARIIKRWRTAWGSSSDRQRWPNIVSGYFVPIVCVIALAAGIAWFIATHEVEFALSIFISVLVIACPCALGLATPTAIMVGTGKGAENGILIKGGEALETAHRINTIVFDKTGTITQGKPSVTDILTAKGVSEEHLLRIAAAAEKGSGHPLGQAIVQEAEDRGLRFQRRTDLERSRDAGSRHISAARPSSQGTAC